ncbi:alpha/beta-hydrolase [Exidia glandulosa HHB12029]|uniref:Alpha/beta-hydrolase n=1 Tax=Exidia glandulosa HHB12029 TaxID=1314781 RepID=A0A165LHA3_EXIGL|nr:alpha/beta-hydrolase [Exidia glandulosa HHB12029]
MPVEGVSASALPTTTSHDLESSPPVAVDLDELYRVLDAPVEWPWYTKLWTYALGFLLQSTVSLLTTFWDWKLSFTHLPWRRPYRQKISLDTGRTGHCRLVVYYPQKPKVNAHPPGVVMHIHGGGWTICHPEIEHKIAQHLADELNTVVVAPDYKKAPWWPYPHALLQLHAVLKWIADNGLSTHPSLHPPFLVDSSRIALSGGSAGANLAASLSLLSSSANISIVGLALLYPLIDLSTPYPTKLARSGLAKSWVVLPPWFSRFILHAYIPPPRSAHDVLVSPLLADASRFPAAVAIATAGEDYLCEEGDQLARKLESAVKVKWRRFEAVGHGFDLLPTPYGLSRRRRNQQAIKEMWEMFVDTLRPVVQ